MGWYKIDIDQMLHILRKQNLHLAVPMHFTNGKNHRNKKTNKRWRLDKERKDELRETNVILVFKASVRSVEQQQEG